MAEFSVKDADKYGGQGGGGYFSLKNDRDTAKVVFPFNDIEDIKGYSVHQIEIDGKKRYVNCLHEYGQPKDDCPFCAAGKFTLAKYFIPVYNVDEDRVQTWERGKQFGDRLTSLCSRNPNLVTHGFEIERIGKKGDTKTTYEIYSDRDNDDPDRTVEDFDVPNPLGTIILDKSAEDMQFYLETGEFPADDDAYNRPTRRESREEDRPTRRPSASSRDNGRDRF